MFIQRLQRLARPIFGEFEHEEFIKFLRMGLVFCFILGSYWTIRVLKTPIFTELVSKNHLPWAKTVSILCLVPIVLLYTRFLDTISHERMFYYLVAVYATGCIIFGFLFMLPTIGQAPAHVVAARSTYALHMTKVLGYA